jgi:hypothetical protein
MGTFHDHLGVLHGITVVVDTIGPTVYIGRCHEADDQRVILLDADEHTEQRAGMSKADYVNRAARWGVFARHDRLVVQREQIISIRPLGAWSDLLDAGQ